MTEHEQAVMDLWSSLLEFTQIFYLWRTGRKFELSQPVSRESHYRTICRALIRVMKGETKRLIINVPPRYGKTELIIHFIAWAMSRYPDSNFMYISYAHTLAKKQTQTIRQIMQMKQYCDLFQVRLADDTTAKDNFETTAGGSVYAVGAGGTITGRGAGIKGSNRFGGAIVIDDIFKPSEVYSDTIRQGINEWYFNTVQSRVNGPNTPIVYIGQCLHEDELVAHLKRTGEWETVVIPALDVHNNALHPEMHTREELLKMKEEMPYVFAAQYQQDPQPAGGGIFKPEWFYLSDDEPKLIATFITADTAETDKTYNDATVFSFWGVYKIVQDNIQTDVYGLYWIDCVETRVEPKDLLTEFMAFYAGCMRHAVKPRLAIVEKKSTGVTLLSTLQKMQGLLTIDLPRNGKSKTDRFLEAQPYVAQRLIALPRLGRHTQMCLEHCRKITANMSHRFDDIADTLYDAIKAALIDKIVTNHLPSQAKDEQVAANVMGNFQKVLQLNRTFNDGYRH